MKSIFVTGVIIANIAARNIPTARRPFPERQRLDEPKDSSRHAYFDSGSETENDISQEQSSRDTIRSSGTPATSTNPGPVSNDIGRSSSKDLKPAPISSREAESAEDCYSSISDDNAIDFDFDGSRRGRESLTEDNLDSQNRQNFCDALPQPSLTSHRYPFIAAENIVYDPFTLARNASIVLEQFRSKIVYLLTMGLPQSDTLAEAEHKETTVRWEDLVMLDDFATSGYYLLLHVRLQNFTSGSMDIVSVSGSLNSYYIGMVTAACADAIEKLEPRNIYGELSCGTDQTLFYDSTIKRIKKWNNNFDEAYHTILSAPEQTCYYLTDRQKCIKYCHGRPRPTGICRMTRVCEWDDGYNGMKESPKWIAIQEIRDLSVEKKKSRKISNAPVIMRRSQTFPSSYRDADDVPLGNGKIV